MPAFGAATTTDEVLEGVSLAGTTAVITGASAGLGQETARALASKGASVVLGVRDLAKGDAAAEPVRAAAERAGAGGTVRLQELDLASLASVRAAADALASSLDRIDVLIANAGVMACPQGRTADGFETQFGTNHLGHFVFVNRLVPLLVSSAPSRIVNLSSRGHRLSDVDLDDPGYERTAYDPWDAYGRSKTANILFAVELDRRLRDLGVRACALHPGGIMTELGRHLTAETVGALRERSGGRALEFKSVPAGAATSVWAAVVAGADEVGGRYCEDCHVAEVASEPGADEGVQPYAVDPERAAALWSLSERLVGETFPPPGA